MVALLALGLVAASPIAAEMQTVRLTVAGKERTFLVSASILSGPAPVVNAFHGHGGKAQPMARKTQIGRLWPEAIAIYLQGLPTATRRDPEGKRSGWNGAPRSQDLEFFGAIQAWLWANRNPGMKNIFVTGHSNGGGFTVALWRSEYGMLLRAIASTAATIKSG